MSAMHVPCDRELARLWKRVTDLEAELFEARMRALAAEVDAESWERSYSLLRQKYLNLAIGAEARGGAPKAPADAPEPLQ